MVSLALAPLAGSASGAPGYAEGTGAAAAFSSPRGLAAGPSGTLYVADSGNNVVRAVTRAGAATTLAGSGAAGSDDGPASAASFWTPSGLALSSAAAGQLYVADTNNTVIRAIALASGAVSTLAGSWACGYADGAGSAAAFCLPKALACDAASGVLYVADSLNYRLRRVAPWGEVSTLAGSGTSAHADGAGTAAGFAAPMAVAVDGSGNVLVADRHRLRAVVVPTPTGSPSPSPSPTPSQTPSQSPTLTPTRSGSRSGTPTPTGSGSGTLTPTGSGSGTVSPTPTPSTSATPTPTASPSATPVVCEAGKYTPPGTLNCTTCPSGQAAIEPGTRYACGPCRFPPQVPWPNASSCAVCPNFLFASSGGIPGTGTCAPCPQNYYCLQQNNRVGSAPVKCAFAGACCFDGNPDSQCTPGSPPVTGCNAGYNGSSCSTCTQGYYLSQNECKQCSSASSLYALLVLPVLLGIFAALVCCIKSRIAPFLERMQVALRSNDKFNRTRALRSQFSSWLTTLSLSGIIFPSIFKLVLNTLRLAVFNLNLTNVGPSCLPGFGAWNFWDNYGLLVGVCVGAPLIFLAVDVPYLCCKRDGANNLENRQLLIDLGMQSLTLDALANTLDNLMQATIIALASTSNPDPVLALSTPKVMCVDTTRPFRDENYLLLGIVLVYFVCFLVARPLCCRTKEFGKDEKVNLSDKFGLEEIAPVLNLLKYAAFCFSCSASPTTAAAWLLGIQAFELFWVAVFCACTNGQQVVVRRNPPHPPPELLDPLCCRNYARHVPLGNFIFAPALALGLYFFVSVLTLTLQLAVNCSSPSSGCDGLGIFLSLLNIAYICYLLAALAWHFNFNTVKNELEIVIDNDDAYIAHALVANDLFVKIGEYDRGTPEGNSEAAYYEDRAFALAVQLQNHNMLLYAQYVSPELRTAVEAIDLPAMVNYAARGSMPGGYVAQEGHHHAGTRNYHTYYTICFKTIRYTNTPYTRSGKYTLGHANCCSFDALRFVFGCCTIVVHNQPPPAAGGGAPAAAP